MPAGLTADAPAPEPTLFPVFLRLAGERVLVVGGGEEAAAKLRLLLPCAARLDVVAEQACEAVRSMAADRRLDLHERPFAAADLAGARLCVVALEDAAEAARVAASARAAGVLVNAVDRPEMSDFMVPAIVDRAPLTVAIGTAGAAPALARDLRARVEAAIPAGYGALTALCRDWRGPVAAVLPDRAARRRFWDAVLDGPEAHGRARRRFGRSGSGCSRPGCTRRASGRRAAPHGRASLVGAGPGDPELLTLRAVRVLKRADVVLYDALVDPAVLDMARRDARRIDVGKRCGRHAMSQAAINRLILEHARARLACGAAQGRRSVRLRPGRGGARLPARGRVAGRGGPRHHGGLRRRRPARHPADPSRHRAGAASRHRAWQGRRGAGPRLARPRRSGGTIAAYMASRTLPTVAARLMRGGHVAGDAGGRRRERQPPNERHLFGTWRDLPAKLAAQAFGGPTLVLIGEVVALAEAAVASKQQAA